MSGEPDPPPQAEAPPQAETPPRPMITILKPTMIWFGRRRR